MFYPIEKAKGLNDLKDTSIVTPVDNDAPVYNSTTQKWENKQITTKEQWKKNGAYNLLPKELYASTQASHGITWTVRSDGSVGTSNTSKDNTNESFVLLSRTSGYTVPAGQYCFCGKPSASKYRMMLQCTRGSVLTMLADLDNDTTSAVVTIQEGDALQVVLIVKSGETGGDTFYPMLTTDLSATNADFTTPAKTNRQLTEELGFGAVGASLASTYVDTSAGSSIGLRKWGHICLLMMQIKTTSSLALNTQQTIATIPSGYIPKYGTFDITFDKGYEKTNESHDIEIDTNGNIKLTLRNTHSNVRWVCATMIYICE